MTFGSRFNKLTVAVIFAMLIICSFSVSYSSQREPMISPEYLRGIDEIVICSSFGGAHNILGVSSFQLDRWIFKSFQGIFSRVPHVRITNCYGNSGIPRGNTASKSAIVLLINISARESTIDGKRIKVAALSFQLRQSRYYSPRVNFSPPQESYPFVVPETKEELRQTIQTGLQSLTAFLPGIVCLGNPGACGKSLKNVQPNHSDDKETQRKDSEIVR